jgi:hypothetical protein
MKSISFSLTEPQFLDGSKDVTRRLGWLKLKAGDRLRAVRKAMGLKKGEHQHVLGEIEVVSVRREPLFNLVMSAVYEVNDVRREGFQQMTGQQFIEFFCKSHRGCKPSTVVTRIEFRRLNNPGDTRPASGRCV